MSNPNGAGGFRDHPEHINRDGRPVRGASLAEGLAEILEEMPPDQRKLPNHQRGKKYRDLFVESVVTRAVEGESWAAKMLMRAVDGDPALNTQAGGLVTLAFEPAFDAGFDRMIAEADAAEAGPDDAES